MPIYSGYVQSSGGDWDQTGSTPTTLTALLTLDGGGVPTVDSRAYANLSTSAVTTGGTITAATFYWKHAKADTGIQMAVAIWNGASYTDLYAGVGGALNGVKSATTTNPTILSYINASGGNQTQLEFRVTTGANGATRRTIVYSYDSSQANAPYVVIEYNAPSTQRRQRIFIIS